MLTPKNINPTYKFINLNHKIKNNVMHIAISEVADFFFDSNTESYIVIIPNSTGITPIQYRLSTNVNSLYKSIINCTGVF